MPCLRLSLWLLFLSFGITNTKGERAIASKQRISVEQIDLIDLRLGDTTELFGRIRNKSPVYTLTRVALELTMHDCVKEDCEIVGKTTENIYVTIPPGQARDFKQGFIHFGTLLKPRGEYKWNYKVLYTGGIREDAR